MLIGIFRALIKLIILHVRLFMTISHVKIIASFNHGFWIFILAQNTVIYIINSKIHGSWEMPDLFLVLSMIF